MDAPAPECAAWWNYPAGFTGVGLWAVVEMFDPAGVGELKAGGDGALLFVVMVAGLVLSLITV